MEGRFNGGFFALPVWGLIFGGAYTWRGLFSEFYGIFSAKSELARISTDHLSTKAMVFGIYDGRDLFSSLLTQNIEQLLSYAENLF